MTGRDGAIDFSAKTALMQNEAVNPDDHIYRVIELVGTSEESIEDAITSAISRANSTLRNLRWFEVVRTSGHIVGRDRAALSGDAEGRLHDGRLRADRSPADHHIGL